MRAFLMTTVVLGLLAAAGASTALAHGNEVLLNDGTIILGEVLSIDEKGVSVKTEEKTLEIDAKHLDTIWYYGEWSERVGDDVDQRIRLALFALENGLFNQAALEYGRAKATNPEKVQEFEEDVLPQLQEGIAERLVAKAKKAHEKGDLEFADRALSLVLTQFPETKAADEARKLIAQIHVGQMDAEQRARDAELEGKTEQTQRDIEAKREDQEKILGSTLRRMDKARDRGLRALRTRSTSKQHREFEAVGKSYEKAIKDLARLREKHADDPDLVARIDELTAQAQKEAIEAYINAGNVFLIRRSYNQALRMANQAVAVDPSSPVAQRFQAKVTTAAQYRGWGWR